jgi:DNA replication and repair protein RecF
VYVRRLSLTNFRCYRRLELTLPRGGVVVSGRNAQGKTSLLEAIYMLATTRAPHVSSDRETVHWDAGDDALPYSRVWGEIARAGGTRSVEVLNVQQRVDGELRYSKRMRVNDVPRRAMDVLGNLNVVLFTPRDMRIVDGPPAERRRYLDGLLCQVEPSYARALSRYSKVLNQRNHLLRKLRDRRGGSDELGFWDDRLVREGSLLLARRLRAVETLSQAAAEIHESLAGVGMSLEVEYRSSLGDPALQSADAMDELPPSDEDAEGRGFAESSADYLASPSPAALEAAFRVALEERRAEQIARGMTTLGPHRDDLLFRSQGVDMRTYGSRGQQRTVTLTMKLAEARVMGAETGERPVILLDDVLSELDPDRRAFLAEHLDLRQQTLITTTDADSLPAEYLAGALVLYVEDGQIRSAERDGRAVTPPVGGVG